MSDDGFGIELTRRKLLAGLGSVGLASAGAGLGTTALFSDEESFARNTLAAGQLDAVVAWQQTRDGVDPTTGEVKPHGVNAYPDDDNDGLMSYNGVQYAGPGASEDPTGLPDVCNCHCAEDEFVVVQDGNAHCVSAFEGSEPVEDVYAYTGSDSPRYTSRSDRQRDDASVLFLYRQERDDAPDVLSLVMIHDSTDGDGGAATFEFDGTGDYRWILEDDDPDEYGGADDFGADVGSADWAWGEGKTDGGVIGALDGEDFAIEITPAFNEAAELSGRYSSNSLGEWEFLSADDRTITLADGMGSAGGDPNTPSPVTVRADCELESGGSLDTPDVFRSEGYPDHERLVELDDVKPGDAGTIQLTFHVCDNDGYVWLTAGGLQESEGGFSEPESEVETSSAPELADNVIITMWYDEDFDGELDDDEGLIFGPGVGGYTGPDGGNPATLSAAMEVAGSNDNRIPLDGDPGTDPMGWDDGPTAEARDCLPAGEALCIGVRWEIPTSVGNEIQGDSASFGLGCYTEQCHDNGGA